MSPEKGTFTFYAEPSEMKDACVCWRFSFLISTLKEKPAKLFGRVKVGMGDGTKEEKSSDFCF